MSRILVVGATGHLGRELVPLLLTRGAQVRALVRRPGPQPLPPATELVRGDLTDPESLTAAAEGIDGLFLLWQARFETLAAALVPLLAARPHVVVLSNITVSSDGWDQGNPATRLHAEMERRVEKAGVPWTFLRPGAFALNARTWWAAQVRAGDVVRWPFAEAANAPVHERDIAEVAARALTEDGHAGAKYLLTGPASLTHRAQVHELGEGIGRSLRFEEVSPAVARAELFSAWPAALAEMLLEGWRASSAGPGLVTSTVADVTGSPARRFRAWAAEHADEFLARD